MQPSTATHLHHPPKQALCADQPLAPAPKASGASILDLSSTGKLIPVQSNRFCPEAPGSSLLRGEGWFWCGF